MTSPPKERSEESLRSQLIELTRDLILIASTEEYPEERARCFRFVCNHLDTLEGMEMRKFESNGYESLLIAPRGVEMPEVLFCGHIDVISHRDREAYQSCIEQGRIVGPGAGDMKGQVAILLELFRSFHSAHPGSSLGLLLTSDEEQGGESGVRYLFQECGVRCEVALIPDGGSLEAITVEEKGILQLKLQSVGESGHAARPWAVRNPYDDLFGAYQKLRMFFDQFSYRDDHWFPTCALTVMHNSNPASNQIPSHAEAILDIRFPPPHTVASLESKLRALLAGTEVTLEVALAAEPVHLDPDPLFAEVLAEITGVKPILKKESGGSDGRHIAPLGISVVIARPWVGQLHSRREWIDIDSMVTFYRVCERYLEGRLLGKG